MSIDLENINLIVSRAVQQALTRDRHENKDEPCASKSATKLTNKRKNDDIIYPSHALVYWVEELKYSTIPYKSIDLNVDLVAALNTVYSITTMYVYVNYFSINYYHV